MKKAQFTTKALLSLIMVVILMGSIGVLSLAASTFGETDVLKNYNLSYGEIVPTDSKLESQKQTYTFYGDSADIYFMQISKGKADARFCIDIFNDKDYQNQIQTFSSPYSLAAGNKALKLTWNFKGLGSGAYYGRCYTYVENEGVRTIDTSSLKTFVINIDRLSKREVKLVSLVNTATGPKITWEAVTTAKTYNVYRRATGETSWTYLYTERNGATSYIDKQAQSGKTYSYTIKCYDGKYVSLYNKNGLTGMYLGMPAFTVTGSGTAGSATIKWNKIPGAAGYNVYRKGGSLSNYTWTCVAKIQNGNTVSYIDTTATSTDWKYTYTVKAYSGNYVSAYKSDGIDFNYIPAPTLSKASCFETGMKIEWKATNTNITGFYVYRKDGTSWKYLGFTKDKFFIDTTAVSNNTYTYTVKANSATNVGAYNATGITAKFLKAPALKKLTFDASYKSLVKWEAVPGATGYKVYRKIADAASWTLIATIKNGSTTSYADACSKTSGVKYTYTVRAFDSNDIHSYFVTAGTSAVCLAKPLYSLKQIFPTDDSTAVEVKWGAINGATKYNVYRRVPGGTWAYLELGITDTTYIDTTAEIGITYDYAVRALNDVGDQSEFYTKSIMPVIRPEIESVIVSEEGSKVIWGAIENADSYTVYRQAAIADGWEAIATVTEAEYIDASEEAKTQHFYYLVSATFGETESSMSDSVANFVFAEIYAEYIPATEDTVDAIKVTVNYEDGSNSEIHKSVNEEEPVLLVGKTESFADTEIFEGYLYTYKLVVTKEGKLGTEVSATAKFPHPPLAKAIITDCTGDYNEGDPFIVLTWEEVEFADKYIIYRAENDGEWIEVGSVLAEAEAPEIDVPTTEDAPKKTYTFRNEGVSSEIDYTYKVVAVATKSERESSESETVSCFIKTLLDKLTGIKFDAERAEGKNVTVTISWDAVKYAEKYEIRRYLPGEDISDNAIGLIANITADSGVLSFTDTARINREYTYKVIAYSEDRGTVENTEIFCWTEVPPVPTDEECLTIVDETTRIEDGYIITEKALDDEISAIAKANDEYIIQTQFETGCLGTGAVIDIYMDGYKLKTYTLIVKGDIDADGVCDVLDYFKFNKIVNGQANDDVMTNLAADLNNDGTVDSVDLELMLEKL